MKKLLIIIYIGSAFCIIHRYAKSWACAPNEALLIDAIVEYK